MRLAVALLLLGCADAESGQQVVDAAASNGKPCAATGPNGCIYTALPAAETCEAGVLAPEWEARALAQVNRARLQAGLPEVTLAQDDGGPLQACTLINALLGQTTSDPPEGSACWSAAAAEACRGSNLTTLGFRVASADPDLVHRSLQIPETFVDSWLVDDDSGGDGVPTLGHRRWLLDPFLGPTQFAMGYAVSTDASGVLVRQVGALRVVTESPTAELVLEHPYVAWPVGETPAAWMALDGWLLVSVVVSTQEPAASAAVDFRGVTVRLTRDGAAVPLATRADGAVDLRTTGAGQGPVHGLPNHLQFRPAEPLVMDADYRVTVEGIAGAGAPTTISYGFRVTP